MKKLSLLLCLIVCALGYSQEVEKEKSKENTIFNRKNELKIGGIKLLAGTIFEVTYEYIYTRDFTFGSSILLNLDTNNDYPEDFSVTPFARFYFQESKEYGAKGFFVEGFAKYYSGKYAPTYYYDEQEDDRKKFSAAALGLSLGKKWVNNSGFVLEILVGAGRTLGNSNTAPDAVFRGDLNIGYRF